MTGLLDRVLSAPEWIVYVVTGVLVFAEDALFFGFVIPGETATVLAGVAAKLGHANIGGVYAVVIAAAILGDSVGFEIGRRLGPRVMHLKPLQKHSTQLQRAQNLLATRGGGAVFLARFIAFFRAVMPALAGASGMPYKRFVFWNALGGIVWGSIFVSIGYFAATSYVSVEKTLGRDFAILIAAISVVTVIAWKVRKSRREKVG